VGVKNRHDFSVELVSYRWRGQQYERWKREERFGRLSGRHSQVDRHLQLRLVAEVFEKSLPAHNQLRNLGPSEGLNSRLLRTFTLSFTMGAKIR
jgi:hypothetical protein